MLKKFKKPRRVKKFKIRKSTKPPKPMYNGVREMILGFTDEEYKQFCRWMYILREQ